MQILLYISVMETAAFISPQNSPLLKTLETTYVRGARSNCEFLETLHLCLAGIKVYSCYLSHRSNVFFFFFILRITRNTPFKSIEISSVVAISIHDT